MPKGRRHVPSTETDGKWFSTVGYREEPLMRKSATATGQMLEESSTQRVPVPEPFNEKTKKTYRSSNPFSIHDNRNSFQDTGEYWGHGLGKKMLPFELRQHYSPKLITQENFFEDETVNRVTYGPKKCKEQTSKRRFPKVFAAPEKGSGKIKLSTSTTNWFVTPDVPYNLPTQTMADSQEPFLKHNPWKYSYNAPRHANTMPVTKS